MNKEQLRNLIRRVLKEADLIKYDDERETELLMMTAAIESNLGQYIRQVGGGPALGIFQMEPESHDDIYSNYINNRPYLWDVVDLFSADESHRNLEYNLAYAIIMARIHYLRAKGPLPEATDIEGMAHYYKKVWNTHLGKSTVEEAVEDYLYYC